MKTSCIFAVTALALCSGCSGLGGYPNNGGYNGNQGYPAYGAYGGPPGNPGYGNYGGAPGYPGYGYQQGYGNYGGGRPNGYDNGAYAAQRQHEQQEAKAKKELEYLEAHRSEIEKLPPNQQKKIAHRAKKLYGELD